MQWFRSERMGLVSRIVVVVVLLSYCFEQYIYMYQCVPLFIHVEQRNIHNSY